MKVFLWLITLALTLVCLTGWAMSELVEHSMKETMATLPIPSFTRLVIFPHGWLLIAPVPWIVYATILTLRRELIAPSVVLFTGTLILFAAFLVCALVVALSLPIYSETPMKTWSYVLSNSAIAVAIGASRPSSAVALPRRMDGRRR